MAKFFGRWRGWLLGGLAAGLVCSGAAAQSIVLTEPAVPLLPQSFGEWTAGGSGAMGEVSLANLSKDALEECGPQRSAVQDYVRGGRAIHMEAVQFNDRTGAFSAFTLAARPDMKRGAQLGSADAVGGNAVVFTVGSTLVVAGGATASDLASLKPLIEGLPKVSGSKGVAPLLPTLLPLKGLVAESVRYALGSATYAAQGGVLPAHSLAWDKSAEAVTAEVADKRGKETLTLLLYPTPAIAGQIAKATKDFAGGGDPPNASVRVRREGELVMLAEGTFAGDEAERMLENIHIKQDVSFDKDVQPIFHVEVQKTYSLLSNIVVLSMVLGLAAVLLGFFLGFGRATLRRLQGKPASTELEFLSLHLAPQNEAPRVDGTK